MITTVITKLLFEPKWVSLDCQVEFGRIQTALYQTALLGWGWGSWIRNEIPGGFIQVSHSVNWIVCSSAGYAQPAKASIVQPWAEPHRDQYSFVSLPPPLRLPPRMGANLTALATVPMSKALGEVSITDALWERGRNMNRTASAHLSTSSSGQELPFSSVFACPSRTTGLATRPLVMQRPCNNCPGSYCC